MINAPMLKSILIGAALLFGLQYLIWISYRHASASQALSRSIS